MTIISKKYTRFKNITIKRVEKKRETMTGFIGLVDVNDRVSNFIANFIIIIIFLFETRKSHATLNGTPDG